MRHGAASGPAEPTVETLDDLYAAYEGRLRRYASGLAGDAMRADDLVQETFIRASAHLALLARLNVYQRQAWLYRTCKNLFLDEQRRHRRQETLVSRLGENVQSEYAGPPSPGTLTQAVLDLAPDRYRDLLYEHYVLGKTSEEIARELKIPPATVRSRLHLAVVWLRRHREEL